MDVVMEPAVAAVGFDLGETLLFYRDTPLSWAALYEPALAQVARVCGLEPTPAQVAAGCAILRQHNTRIVPREREVPSDEILAAILAAWQVTADPGKLAAATESFFGFFQQRTACYPDTLPVLTALRSAGLPMGVLTDVPYGMPASFVRRDLRTVGIADFLDAVLTSGEIGWRKPAADGFTALATRLGTTPEKMLFVGNEAKDVRGAVRAGAWAVFLDHDHAGTDHGQQATVRRLTDLLPLLAALGRGAAG